MVKPMYLYAQNLAVMFSELEIHSTYTSLSQQSTARNKKEPTRKPTRILYPHHKRKKREMIHER